MSKEEDNIEESSLELPEITAKEEESIIIPKELSSAPEDVKECYMKWVALDREVRGDSRRFFVFVDQASGESRQVDLMGLPGRTQQLARSRNISESDLKVLDVLVDEFHHKKILKSKLGFKWKAYTRPRTGKSIMEWCGADIIDYYSKYMNESEIISLLEKKGYVVNESMLLKFFTDNKITIDRKRLEWIKTVKDHYLATDAGRMETLAILHGKFMNIFSDLSGKDLNSSIRAEMKSISAEIRGILEQARRELKGEEVKLTIDGKIDVSASIRAASMIHELSKKIPLHIIPVYMVAAKMGMNPNHILTSLVTSFYKDFNGFSRLTVDKQPMLTNDIIRNYNWDEIRMYHENLQDVESVDYEELPVLRQEQAKSKREILLGLLKDKTGDSK